MKSTLEVVPLKLVKPNRLNPRLEFRQEALDDLARSLGRDGIVEPIVVRRKQGSFEVVVGERRYRAAQQAGLTVVPALIVDMTDDEVLAMNLTENVLREDLNDVEKGRCCIRLLESSPARYPNASAIASRLGMSVKTVNFWIQTARELSPDLQKLVARSTERGRDFPRGRITSDVAVRIARKIPEERRQVEIAQAIADRRVPRAAAREVLKGIARNPEKPVERIIQEVVGAPPEVPFRLAHAEKIRTGSKTQTSRKSLPDQSIRPGTTLMASIYEPKYLKLRVTAIQRKRLDEFTEEDARREGGYSLPEFKEIWGEIHEEGWDPAQSVYVIRFARVK